MQIQTHPTNDASTPAADAIERASEVAVQQSETREDLIRVVPAVDIFENQEELQLVVDVPGVTRDAIELNVERGLLSITATDAARNRVFRRAFTLSDTIDPSGVEAELKDGVLCVHLRKREDMVPRRVEIRSGG